MITDDIREVAKQAAREAVARTCDATWPALAADIRAGVKDEARADVRDATLRALARERDALAEKADKYMWQVRDTCRRAEAAEAERDALRQILRPFAATGQVMDCINDDGGYVWISYEDEDETERNLPVDALDKPLVGACASWKNVPASMPGPMLTPAMFIAAWKALEGWRPDALDALPPGSLDQDVTRDA